MTAEQKKRILDTCEQLDQKLTLASHRLECGQSRTIINIDDAEHTVLTWALRYYWDKVENTEEAKP